MARTQTKYPQAGDIAAAVGTTAKPKPATRPTTGTQTIGQSPFGATQAPAVGQGKEDAGARQYQPISLPQAPVSPAAAPSLGGGKEILDRNYAAIISGAMALPKYGPSPQTPLAPPTSMSLPAGGAIATSRPAGYPAVPGVTTQPRAYPSLPGLAPTGLGAPYTSGTPPTSMDIPANGAIAGSRPNGYPAISPAILPGGLGGTGNAPAAAPTPTDIAGVVGIGPPRGVMNPNANAVRTSGTMGYRGPR